MFSSNQPLVSNALPISFDIEDSEEDLIPTISLIYKRIANSVNSKENALYTLTESATFQQYFTEGNPQVYRNVYRKVIDFGPLPNAGTKDVPHGIAFDANCSLTRLYGASTDPTAGLQYIPLPFAHPIAGNSIALFATGTVIRVITGINYSNFIRTTIVIEYTKNL